jgi:hypothetical protein
MKRLVLLVLLSMILVLVFSTAAFAKNAGTPAIVGDTAGRATSSVNATAGYVYWYAAQTIASLNVLQDGTPHGNYVTTTVKCAVCHSVHGAAATGELLLSGTVSGSCALCHGAGSTIVGGQDQISISPTGNTPHSSCLGYCHSSSPHGVGSSEYLSLKAHLLVANADTRIGEAIVNSAATSITAAVMNDTNIATMGTGVTLGTGYICSRYGCHNNTGSAFAIKGSKNTMKLQDAAGSVKQGHPVTGALSADWGATHDGVQNPAVVAWNSVANGCGSCHDYVDPATNNLAFPHNRLGTRLWMTAAANAGATKTPILSTTTNVIDGVVVNGSGDYYSTAIDGACLKCHLAAGGTIGVGKTW